jgi:hypothetical protein
LISALSPLYLSIYTKKLTWLITGLSVFACSVVLTKLDVFVALRCLE